MVQPVDTEMLVLSSCAGKVCSHWYGAEERTRKPSSGMRPSRMLLWMMEAALRIGSVQCAQPQQGTKEYIFGPEMKREFFEDWISTSMI